MNTTPRTRQRNSRNLHGVDHAPRAGVAMLLVLISLATATILTMAYLSSRDNSAEIGANVANSAQARWSAMTGLELGIAILETEADWRTAHTNGVLLDDHPVDNGVVDLLVEDLETEAPPTDATDNVRLTAIAMSNGVRQTATAIAYVDDQDADEIDVDLSEFVVFAANEVHLKDTATITRWPVAPSSKLGKRVSIGSQSTGSGTVRLENDAAAIDTTVFHGPGASDSMVLRAGGPEVQTTGLMDNIPLPDPPAFPVSPPSNENEDENSRPTFNLNQSYDIVSTDIHAHQIELNASGITLQLTDMTMVMDDDLRLRPNTAIVVNGDVTIVVFDDMSMDNGSYIEVSDGASLKMYIAGDLAMDDAYIGNLREDRSVRDSSGGASYMNPERIQIIGGTNSAQWTAKDYTVVKSSIYAPYATIKIPDDSAFYGRVAASGLEMTHRSAIFYDHALDSGGGYTNPDSKLFGDDGRLHAGLGSLNSLTDNELAELAEALGTPINSLLGGLLGGGGGEEEEQPVSPSDPTPRTVKVTADFETQGQDPKSWESRSNNAVVLKYLDASTHNATVSATQ